jgi:hypothetical protein
MFSTIHLHPTSARFSTTVAGDDRFLALLVSVGDLTVFLHGRVGDDEKIKSIAKLMNEAFGSPEEVKEAAE